MARAGGKAARSRVHAPAHKNSALLITIGEYTPCRGRAHDISSIGLPAVRPGRISKRASTPDSRERLFEILSYPTHRTVTIPLRKVATILRPGGPLSDHGHRDGQPSEWAVWDVWWPSVWLG